MIFRYFGFERGVIAVAARLQRGRRGVSVSKGKKSVSHAHSTRGVFAFVSHAASGLLTKSYNDPKILATVRDEIPASGRGTDCLYKGK